MRRASGASPTLPDCYDLDVELPLVPLPKPADLMAVIDADPDVIKVREPPLPPYTKYGARESALGFCPRKVSAFKTYWGCWPAWPKALQFESLKTEKNFER